MLPAYFHDVTDPEKSHLVQKAAGVWQEKEKQTRNNKDKYWVQSKTQRSNECSKSNTTHCPKTPNLTLPLTSLL